MHRTPYRLPLAAQRSNNAARLAIVLGRKRDATNSAVWVLNPDVPIVLEQKLLCFLFGALNRVSPQSQATRDVSGVDKVRHILSQHVSLTAGLAIGNANQLLCVIRHTVGHLRPSFFVAACLNQALLSHDTRPSRTILDDEVTLIIYVLRWLSDTLPVEQQTATYRRRKAEMERMLGNYRNRGARCL